MINDDASSLAGSIFISYRRDDTGESAGRIYDWLVREFPPGAVFKDVESIPYGVDFRTHLQEALGRCRIVLVLIGPQWSSICDKHGNRRLEDPRDFVRIEIETALVRDDLRVIPILVGNAHPPSPADLPETLQELAFRNAAGVRRDPDFTTDMGRLIAQVKLALQPELAAETSRNPLAGPEPAAVLPAAITDPPKTTISQSASDEMHRATRKHVPEGDPSAPPELPKVHLRFHRHCIAGMRGVFQLKVENLDWRQFAGARLTLKSSSWRDRDLEVDLFPLLPGEEAFDTFVTVFSDAGPGTIQSCTLSYPGAWGTLTAQGRWPGEFPVLSYEAAVMAARRTLQDGQRTQPGISDQDRLNDYLLQDVQAVFVPIRFSVPQISIETLPDQFRDSLLGMDVKKVPISRSEAVWFGQYPVRQKDWTRLMTGSLALQRARADRELADGEYQNCPMHYVDMEEARSFCDVLNEEAGATGLARPGYLYRLPTAMEWRIACGFETLTDGQLNDEAWHGGRELNSCQPVGRLRPNLSGLYDMRGNVFEWCLPDSSAATGGFIAGGSWFNNGPDRQACRSGQPGPCNPGTRSSRIGFRVVLARQAVPLK